LLLRLGGEATLLVQGALHSLRKAAPRGDASVSERPAVAQLIETPGALLSRSDLRELGLERRAVDAVFRACPTVALPGYSRPLIRAEDYLALIRENTYNGDRVRIY
jgi:hypothetical protein